MTSQRGDASLAEAVVYACRCGVVYSASRWRFVDGDSRPDLVEQVRTRGPFEGTCPSCGATAESRAAWLLVRPTDGLATLVIDDDRRGEVIERLSEHLDVLRRHPDQIMGWLLQPEIEFRTGAPASTQPARKERVPDPDRREDSIAGVPKIIGVESPTPIKKRAALASTLGELLNEDGQIRVAAHLDEGEGEPWRDAALTARPIHLREHGYPLAGVRIVGSYRGQVGCIDALIDVGTSAATDVFRSLSERFVVEFVLTGGSDEVVIEREVTAAGLERNAALCLESARGLLASGEYPPEAFAEAREALAATSVEDRLKPAGTTIAGGAYQHLVGASETMQALAHLDRISRPDDLARLTEVDGLPISEYEDIRKSVLQASVEHGLCAPRRFWRRVLASGLATDVQDYANQLAHNRAALQGTEGDLDENENRSAWAGLLDLCERKDIPPPLELRQALGLPEPAMLVDDAVLVDEADRPLEAAGEIKSAASAQPKRRDTLVPGEVTAKGDTLRPGEHRSEAYLGERLRDPDGRLKAATAALDAAVHGHDLEAVLDALEDFDTEELLAILPNLSELGPPVIPGLIAKLKSERREVRQAAIILLGLARDREALKPLSDHLVWEPTTVWVDVARALGGFGREALGPLCALLRHASDEQTGQEALRRVARAMAEIAVSGEAEVPLDEGQGHVAVRSLVDATDHAVSTAARRALATLHEVSLSGAQVRGERPFGEVTEIRGFSRRAYEAIMVPELELLEDTEA